MELVNIGFIHNAGVSDKMLRLANLHAKGFTTKITSKSRKMLFALSFPVKESTTTLKTPPRPVIEPVFEQEKNNISKNIELKFFKAIERYWNEK